MIEKARTIIDRALNSVDEVEIFFYKTQTNEVYDQIANVETNHALLSGAAVRTFKKHGAGFAFSNNLEDLEKTVLQSCKLCELESVEETSENSLPSPQTMPKVYGTFDQSIVDLSSDAFFQFVDEMKGSCTDSKVKPMSSALHTRLDEIWIVNSNGLELYDRGTYCTSQACAISKSNSGQMIRVHENSRSWNLNPTDIGEKARKLARLCSNPKKIDYKPAYVILSPQAFAGILSSVFTWLINGLHAVYGVTPLSQKENKQIGADNLQVVDDGTINGGIGSCTFDDEGSPSSKTSIIEDGVFRSFIWDHSTARAREFSSTGNAVRFDFTDPPSIHITNLVVSPTTKYDELISLEKRAVLVHDITHVDCTHPFSGNYTLTIRNAFDIKNGQIMNALEKLEVSSNLFDDLMTIRDVGDDIQQVDNVMTGSVVIDNSDLRLRFSSLIEKS